MRLSEPDLWEFELVVVLASLVLIALGRVVAGRTLRTWSAKAVAWILLLEVVLVVAGYYVWMFFLVQWE